MDPSVATEPVRVSISVNVSRERAFKVFTEEIGSWWPLATHSIENDDVVGAELDGRVGGLIVERHADGGEARWGTVTVWEPPARLVFSWNPTYEERSETEVEVAFVEDGPETTRVELQHGGWERVGKTGAELREGYVTGWAYIMRERYASVFEDA
jgi:uncharacterized protein YndB with AHSA1/START domain